MSFKKEIGNEDDTTPLWTYRKEIPVVETSGVSSLGDGYA